MERKIKLLVVDDEEQNTKVLQEILSFYPKYRSVVAYSGEECLKILDTYNPDIILLDIMMPGLNGYEVCRKIRLLETHKYSKVIMVSGLSMVDDRLKAYSSGADDYITKPFVEDELIAKLEVFSKLSRMEEVDELKTTALNILSHEARTPLNGLFLALDLLEREHLDVESTTTGYINILRSSSERLRYLLEKISRFCEVKSGINVIFAKGSAVNLVDDIITKLDVGKRDISFEKEYVGDVEVITDWNLLYEVMFEIIENAVKNSPVKGIVKIKWRNSKGEFLFIVEDSGPGIDEGMREKIFQSLYSADVLHHSSGVGLSMAITDAIVNLLGGSIVCDESEEGGAKFIIKMGKS